MLKLLVVVFLLLLVTCKFERKKAILGIDILSSSVTPTENTIPEEAHDSSSSPVQETVATPTFSPAGGTYNSDQTVTIQTTTPGASIHFITDGTNPTTSSPLYLSPISVAGNGTTMTIKAIAVKSGMLDSQIASDTWHIQYD